MFKLRKIKKEFKFLQDIGFVVKMSNKCIKYINNNLLFEIRYSYDYRDDLISVIIKTKEEKCNLLDSSILSEIERKEYLREFQLLYEKNFEQCLIFYSNLIKSIITRQN
ncbi:MAG: hypothetical protein FWC11_05220 [Firmicutes bacterium]|nr:hypothetical protein [Bacillota bacterium]MCL2255859.1 hypothetical protein [Bacillota bacterium]MCL2256243.1 hypothetical protein [Bacillota bacterium]